MKKAMIILLLFAFESGRAQTLIDSLTSLRFSLDDSTGIKLAELAMNNPGLKILDEQIEAGKYEWGIQKAGWLNNFNASFNLNEGNLRNAGPTDAIGFYPRYNFNLSLPLGNFFTRGKQAKKARSQYEETIHRKELQKTELKEAVLIAYTNYQMQNYLYSLQESVVRDEKTTYDIVENKFKANSITLEAFIVASKKLNDALVKRVTLMRDLNVSKYQLESLIGMPLEEALKLIKNN